MPSRESQNQAEPPCRLADEETEARHGPAAGLRPSASGQLCGSLGPRPRLPLPGYGDARPTACAPPLRRPTRQVRLTPRVAPPPPCAPCTPTEQPSACSGPCCAPPRRLAQGGVPRQPCWPQAPWLPGLAGASAHTRTHCTLPGPEPGPSPAPPGRERGVANRMPRGPLQLPSCSPPPWAARDHPHSTAAETGAQGPRLTQGPRVSGTSLSFD